MKQGRFTISKTGFVMGLVLFMAPLAYAGQHEDELANQVLQKSPDFQLNNFEKLNISTSDSEFVGLSSSLHNVVTELSLPTETVGSKLFDLDFTDAGCISGESSCLSRNERIELTYGKSMTKSLDQKLDIQLTPRAAVNFQDESSSALVGALVRIGDDLRDDSDFKTNTWYMFAGADAEAVTYAPNNSGLLRTDNFNLQNQILVGDAQAGVGYRMGDKDITLGYFRRKVTSFGKEQNMASAKFSEDAAAVSFTWRR